MHPIRVAAQAAYDAAMVKAIAAENGNDEQAYADADAALTVARRSLCAAEIEYPTPKEAARAANLLRLRNRGLDV